MQGGNVSRARGIRQKQDTATQAGPYLRTQEGDVTAVLCNYDEQLEECPSAVTASDQEQARSLRGAESGATDSGDLETKILFTRENVSMFPARKQRITGRVSLLKLKSAVFFSWLPYRQPGASSDDSPAIQEAADQGPASALWQYAEHPRPLSHFKAIRKHTPKLGGHQIVLILRNGLTLPPFYFGSGGVRALFSVLKQNVVLTKSLEDPSTHLINDAEDPLQRSLATLDLSDLMMIHPAHLAKLPSSGQGHDGAESSQYGHLICRVRDGVQRASQYCRESFMQNVRSSPSALSPDDNDRERETRAETEVGLFELLDRSESDSMIHGLEVSCAPPLTQDEWFVFLDAAGRVVDEKGLRTRIFKAGVEPGIRKEVWQYLLGLHPAGKTAAHRKGLVQGLRQEYEQLKAQWTTIADKQAARFGKWRERKSRVEKDVRRIDSNHPFYAGDENPNAEMLRQILLTYSMYNFDLGYCQGMSDLASPILYIMQDEAVAFWCFVNLMDRMEANFSDDSTSMQAQLDALQRLVQLADPELHAFIKAADSTNYFFCYRWLLVHFKREFTFDEVLRLWEAIWSCPLTPHFPIYLCAAALLLQKQAIMRCAPCFDELLGFCVLLSGNMNLARVMRRAESLYHAAGSAGWKCLAGLDRAA